jgi:hypothetical protein
MVIADAWWKEGCHGSAGITKANMASLATKYYEFAKSDPLVIGIAAFIWPTFSEGMGLRDLSQNVIDEHMRIGKLITGKGMAPSGPSGLSVQ